MRLGANSPLALSPSRPLALSPVSRISPCRRAALRRAPFPCSCRGQEAEYPHSHEPGRARLSQRAAWKSGRPRGALGTDAPLPPAAPHRCSPACRRPFSISGQAVALTRRSHSMFQQSPAVSRRADSLFPRLDYMLRRQDTPIVESKSRVPAGNFPIRAGNFPSSGSQIPRSDAQLPYCRSQIPFNSVRLNTQPTH